MLSLHSDRAKVHILNLGQLSCPGKAVYGSHPNWEHFHPPDPSGMVSFPTRAILACFPSRTVLVDCGYGIDFSEQLALEFRLTREPFLARAFDVLGIASDDVNDVVLTHPHFDHVQGALTDGVPTFPKARYHIQQKAWETAPDLQWKTELASHINLLDGDTEIFPGVRATLTGGHSAGHQSVLVESLLFMADVCPTRFHLEHDCIMGYDIDPAATKVAKRSLFKQAEDQGWTIIFSHDPEHAFLRP